MKTINTSTLARRHGSNVASTRSLLERLGIKPVRTTITRTGRNYIEWPAVQASNAVAGHYEARAALLKAKAAAQAETPIAAVGTALVPVAPAITPAPAPPISSEQSCAPRTSEPTTTTERMFARLDRLDDKLDAVLGMMQRMLEACELAVED